MGGEAAAEGPSERPRRTRGQSGVLIAVILAAVLLSSVALWLETAVPRLTSVSLTAIPGSTLNQTALIAFAASAWDADGRNVTDTADWSWTVGPEGALQVLPTPNVFEMSARAAGSGTVNVTVEAALGGARRQATSSLHIDAVRLAFGGLAVAAAGEPVVIPITAVRSDSGVLVMDYTGTVHFASSDPAARLPMDFTFFATDHGTHDFSFTLGTAGPQLVQAADTDAPAVAGSTTVRADHRPEANFTFAPDPADPRTVTFASTSRDPDADPIASLAWTFGDGTTGMGASPVHTFPGDGPFGVRLTATDVWGLASSPATRIVANGTVGWFAPLPPQLEVTLGRPFVGSLDFMDLFNASAPWTAAASHIRVFKLYGEDWATDTELSQILGDLNRRGMAIAVEVGPLVATSACGDGIEGFDGPATAIRWATRMASLGGTLRFIAMDEPYAGAVLADGPTACHWSPERTAWAVGDFMARVHAAFPDVVIGDIEPLFAGLDVSAYEGWIRAFRSVNGYEFPFFHLDLDWGRLDWPAAAKRLEGFARSRGIQFGMIYNGLWTDPSDAEWVGHAEERMARYEGQEGGRPDDAIFQSWVDKPDYCLPETNASTFTHLIDVYFRNRTALALSVGPSAANGSRPANGSLRDAAGNPITGAPVELVAQVRDGPGLFAEVNLSGIVPPGAFQATVGMRVNSECGCGGTAQFLLYEVRYTEGGETASRVPNGDFSLGLDGWGSWGATTPVLEPSDRGTGWMLNVSATATDVIAFDSGHFSVTAGAVYHLTFAARIAPSSEGHGYFAVFFMSSQELRRDEIPLEGATLHLAATMTDAAGAFQVVLPALPPYTFLIEATYAGDERLWSSYASRTAPP